MKFDNIPQEVITSLKKGEVIPALPLALDSSRKLDEHRQRALIRYYLDSGVGGIAVAVHTTQFAIRQPEVSLFTPLLEIANEEFNRFSSKNNRPVIRIAGAIGKTGQAKKEAQLALDNGFHAVLLSVAAFHDSDNSEIIEHCKAIAEIIPVIGFYLQPAVGGRKLDVNFWREFDGNIQRALLLANQITDSNATFFDAANNFAGCIVGLHEVLRRQGILEGLWTLDKNEVLSRGQKEEIDRVYSSYPDLNDDLFINENIDLWLS